MRFDAIRNVISGESVETIEGYAGLNFEVASCSSFRDIQNKKAHQLVGQCKTRRHSSNSDCRIQCLPSLVPKTFVHYRTLTCMGELTATTIRHQSLM